MKYLKLLFCILGVVGLIIGTVWGVQQNLAIQQLFTEASRVAGSDTLPNPSSMYWVTIGVAALGGLLLGLGIGLPKRTSKAIAKNALRDAEPPAPTTQP